jgi:chromosome segregation ATPase
MDHQPEAVDNRLSAVEDRLDRVEIRLDKIEQQLRSHSDQFARLDQRLIALKEILDVERRLARLEAHAGLSGE